MAMKSFLHYVFGELLSIDYVIGNNIQQSNVTLNIVNKISSRKLFEMTRQVLIERGIGLRLKDNIYYIYQLPSSGKSNVVLGFGRSLASIPQNGGQILQLVPLKYGIRISVERTLKGLVDAQITADFEQGALFIQGRREQIVRAIELINLLDVPSNRGQNISLISPVYMSTEQFIETVTELLQTEGVDVGRTTQKQENLVFVPITQLGSIAVFSAEKELLQRVEYWAQKIDQPTKGNEKQYHIYTPRFARASDLGESIAPLISSNIAGQARPTNNAKDNKSSAQIANNQPVNTSVSNDKMSMVIDQRSNTLIFHSSGVEYQSLLPLIRRMDILPKQVLLSVTIAEVTLQGIFKRGFEYAVTSGKFGATTKGAFGLEAITGISLNWASGLNEVMADFVEENSYVNILSKPSILVRDGTEASINVGDRVPVSSGSSTGVSGDVITENITYRETGIKLNVAPTVNAQGVVIMKITQDISNQVADQAGKGGNPIFFERNITTEVVADSGQTILLGGLISDNQSNSDKGVPFIKSIPLLGALFESESKTNTKTELVIMVTPKIVERSDQWQGILNSFEQVLENINLVD
jgi:general secretion pathway protein D